MAAKRIAIVTGASAGLGMDYAREAEKQFQLDEIWLVARRLEPMQKLASELNRSRGVCLAIDLASSAGISQLVAKLENEKPELVLLVNNAGYGKLGNFAELGLDEQLGEIDLNVRSLTELTYRALPYMRRGSYILQIASSVGFAPAPKFAVYAATKAYVVSLSYALRNELAEKGISVTAVCPGPVATEFSEVARRGTGFGGKSLSKTRMAAPSPAVVELSFYDLKAGRAISVYGWTIRLFVIISKILPNSWMAWILSHRT